MTTNTGTSWKARHDAGRDASWQAWYRLGLDPYAHALGSNPAQMFEGFARSIGAAIDPLGMELLAQLEVDLEPDAKRRILERAALDIVKHLPWALNGAVGDELARTEPMPFTAPPAGSWVRVRALPQEPDTNRHRRRLPDAPEWEGAWHLFTGDIRRHDERAHRVTTTAHCGARMTLRDFSLFGDGRCIRDHVVSDALPTVDACGRCRRAPRAVR